MFVTKFKVKTSPWEKIKGIFQLAYNIVFILIAIIIMYNCVIWLRHFFNF